MKPFFTPAIERTLCVMPTYRCTAACSSCGTFSSPRDKNVLAPHHTLRVIDEAAEAGYQLVVFTGGEATLEEEQTLAGIERARSYGMITRLVTNAWWASNDAEASTTLTRYCEAGLQELNVSTGDQHIRFVSVENVIRAVAAARRLGLASVAVMVELTERRQVTKDSLQKHPLYQELLGEIEDGSFEILESPWMPVSPRGVEQYPEGMVANKDNVRSRKGCDSVLTTTTVQADGRIAACCGLGMRSIAELQIGTVETTSIRKADSVASDDFLKRWIRVDGPEKILDWASTFDPSIQWEDMYAHRCQACLRLYRDPKVRRVLRERHHLRVADVVQREFVLSAPAPTDSSED